MVGPSGKLTWQCKITIFNREYIIHFQKGPFFIAMLVYRRVPFLIFFISWQNHPTSSSWQFWCQIEIDQGIPWPWHCVGGSQEGDLRWPFCDTEGDLLVGFR